MERTITPLPHHSIIPSPTPLPELKIEPLIPLTPFFHSWRYTQFIVTT